MRREFIIRWTFFTIGLVILALGVAFTIKGKVMGIGPWDVFHYGLFKQLGLSIGTWSIITGIIIILATWAGTKTPPKAGAVLNMLLLGVFIDLFNALLITPQSFLVQFMFFVIGVIILGFGISLYVSADVGAGPRDSLMLLIVEKTGWSIAFVRNGMEVAVFLLGWLLGGPVGIGTVFIALFLGKIIQMTLPICQKWLKHLIENRLLHIVIRRFRIGRL
ncbi:putative membrane protein YczE [Bacillus ectoiniformans]|uniref:YczE/YyaS/YitT family protein n=1 Tax=Bacillus ectoiniformans TaxID=1494429 RepID=UPI001959D3B3|nr:YitT family protein [Bacillus ectoiniformans]MBM7648641.1 putative membrane protein YczE [Bacillus ectoiniformans]